MAERTKRILLVHGNEGVRRAYRLMLSRPGVEIVDAPNGLMAMAELAKAVHGDPFDIVLTGELKDNTTNGLELAKYVGKCQRGLGRKPPLVALSTPEKHPHVGEHFDFTVREPLEAPCIKTIMAKLEIETAA